MAIASFRCKETRAVFEGDKAKRFATFRRILERKLTMLHAATRLDDLRAPPANRLEQLYGDREGQHSIRVNDQFRICFVWTAEGPRDVECVDYH